MNGGTVAGRLPGAVPTKQNIHAATGQSVEAGGGGRPELLFSDPALDQFAGAMALTPLRFAGWTLFSAVGAVSGLVRPVRRIDVGRPRDR
jgi:hypothetical protein